MPELSHASIMKDASKAPAVSVVVPVFNEEANMSNMQAELRSALAGLDHEIIFVDDGSTDQSVAKIENTPRVRTLRFEKNAGQSAALFAGLTAARGAIIVTIDSDLQNDPAEIPRLLAEISHGADLVCGYREKRKDTMVKRLTSRIANFVRSRYTRAGVRDTGCTLKPIHPESMAPPLPSHAYLQFLP